MQFEMLKAPLLAPFSVITVNKCYLRDSMPHYELPMGYSTGI